MRVSFGISVVGVYFFEVFVFDLFLCFNVEISLLEEGSCVRACVGEVRVLGMRVAFVFRVL